MWRKLASVLAVVLSTALVAGVVSISSAATSDKPSTPSNTSTQVPGMSTAGKASTFSSAAAQHGDQPGTSSTSTQTTPKSVAQPSRPSSVRSGISAKTIPGAIRTACTPTSLLSWSNVNAANNPSGSGPAWQIQQDGGDCVLHIYGGTEPDLRPAPGITNIPWSTQSDQITKIELDGAVTVNASAKVNVDKGDVPENAGGLFANLPNLRTFRLSNQYCSLTLQGYAADLIFYNDPLVTSIDTSHIVFQTTYQVPSLSIDYGFAQDQSLPSIDLSNLDLRTVKSVQGLFEYTTLHELALGGLGGKSGIEDMSYMFYHADLSHLNIPWRALNMGQLKDLDYMFAYATGFTSGNFNDLYDIDVSTVTTMRGMFRFSAEPKPLDLHGWHLDSIVDMTAMFEHSSFTSIDFTGWSIGPNVRNFSYMFAYTQGLTSLDLSSWAGNHATNLSHMIYDDWGLEHININGLVTSYATNIEYMLAESHHITELDFSVGGVGVWDTSNVTNMRGVFSEDQGLVKITGLETWNTAKVTNMSRLFAACDSLTSLSGLSNWETGEVTGAGDPNSPCTVDPDGNSMSESDCKFGMHGMFVGDNALPEIDGLSGWDTSNVKDMGEMFANCEVLTTLKGGISHWGTGSVTTMANMFENNALGDSNLDFSQWDTGSVTDMTAMFHAPQAPIDLSSLSHWNTGNVTTMREMFESVVLKPSTALDMTLWNTESVINMDAMFDECASMSAITLFPKTDHVVYMTAMFDAATFPASYTMPNWKARGTHSVQTMNSMFAYTHVDSIDISGLDTAGVLDMSNMFSGTEASKIPGLSTMDVDAVTAMGQMFSSADKLIELDISGWNNSAAFACGAGTGPCRTVGKLTPINGTTSMLPPNLDLLKVGTTQKLGDTAFIGDTIAEGSSWLKAKDSAGAAITPRLPIGDDAALISRTQRTGSETDEQVIGTYIRRLSITYYGNYSLIDNPVLKTETTDYGDPYHVLKATDFTGLRTKPGHYLAKWLPQKNGTKGSYAFGELISPTKPMQLAASWAEKSFSGVIVKFDHSHYTAGQAITGTIKGLDPGDYVDIYMDWPDGGFNEEDDIEIGADGTATWSFDADGEGGMMSSHHGSGTMGVSASRSQEAEHTVRPADRAQLDDGSASSLPLTGGGVFILAGIFFCCVLAVMAFSRKLKRFDSHTDAS
ncbi:BspA family leucine-rich repeat surface protein [Bifidobacterium sp. ESL0798]|uniref:BspA family leucine-rich repeat surface protein n=1 Tax=Bifidobacterium sp. ESL0798 TaxID=2983235 RepID=UPI0023F9E897|nr:BspA family leucine-rich repeat surface protein [Bifidobacterium sp. ESL0798]WEV74667.1 BspA family leucine-rich repeat surface protein [Bifidobacterium sp. ESL0798]